MTLVRLNEEQSEKASIAELAQVFEETSDEMTISDALMQLKVFDPGRQRSLSAAFMKELLPEGKYAHLVGIKVFPSTTARGRSSKVFNGIRALPPKAELVRRSDAFRGMRAIDKSPYSTELARSVEKVTALNLTGKSGSAINAMALEFDHALELKEAKLRHMEDLAAERQKTAEQLMEVINRITPNPDMQGRSVRVAASADKPN